MGSSSSYGGLNDQRNAARAASDNRAEELTHRDTESTRRVERAAENFKDPEKQALLRVFLEAMKNSGEQANKAWKFDIKKMSEEFVKNTEGGQLGFEVDARQHAPFRPIPHLGTVNSFLLGGGLCFQDREAGVKVPKGGKTKDNLGVGFVGLQPLYERVSDIAEGNDLRVESLLPRTLLKLGAELQAAQNDIKSLKK